MFICRTNVRTNLMKKRNYRKLTFWSSGLALCLSAIFLMLCSCASGAADERWDASTQPEVDGSVDSSHIDGPEADPDSEIQDCSDGCNNPPGECYISPGNCVDGQCEYPFKAEGVSCNDEDPCTVSEVCNGNGACIGEEMDCTRQNASGGSCVDGVCQGWACVNGWGDCNDNMDDGCEQRLDTLQHCGECDFSCPSRPNSTVACNSGDCDYTCESPWEDCNNDMSDGCEIPTGEPNTCDLENGLNSSQGCGTAYCGTAPTPNKTQNYGSWYCIACANCHEPEPGMWQWCNHSGTGRWYPAESGTCAAHEEDVVCSP